VNTLQTKEASDQRTGQPLAESKKPSSGVNSFLSPVVPLLAVVGVMWLVRLVDTLWRGVSFTEYGIHPRTTEGLWQIPLAPFIHADLAHLIANTIPLLILGYLIIIREKRNFALVFIIAMIVSGLGIWLLGAPETVHMGASGVVFGFMGYLLARGYFERSFISILFGIVALLLYGGILTGILPGQPGVSWLGHLFGLAGGVLAAWAAHRSKTQSGAAKKKAKSKSVNQVVSDPDIG
jgi:membrane associated rhomboid family serine protease